MRGTVQKFAALGVLAALAAGSQAAISINIANNVGYTTGSGTAVVDNDDLYYGLDNLVPVTGTFQFSSSVNQIIQINSQVKTSGVTEGLLSFNAEVQQAGADGVFGTSDDITTPILGRTTANPSADEVGLNPAFQTTTVALASGSLYRVNYTANYAGAGYAYINQAVFVFTEDPVPEPASMAAIGVGLVGLVARRRKGAK